MNGVLVSSVVIIIIIIIIIIILTITIIPREKPDKNLLEQSRNQQTQPTYVDG